MATVFNANEVFEMAKQIERNGAAFYRKAAKNSPAGAKLLLEIAGQEDQHLVTFEQMQKQLSGREVEDTAFDPDGEAAQYLKTMADGYVFDVKTPPTDLLKGKETLADIIRIAIGLEKDSIVFYSAMREMVSQRLGGDKLMGIIKEELKHIRWLADKRREATGARA